MEGRPTRRAMAAPGAKNPKKGWTATCASLSFAPHDPEFRRGLGTRPSSAEREKAERRRFAAVPIIWRLQVCVEARPVARRNPHRALAGRARHRNVGNAGAAARCRVEVIREIQRSHDEVTERRRERVLDLREYQVARIAVAGVAGGKTGGNARPCRAGRVGCPVKRITPVYRRLRGGRLLDLRDGNGAGALG